LSEAGKGPVVIRASSIECTVAVARVMDQSLPTPA
jgi:hypothetical protein